MSRKKKASRYLFIVGRERAGLYEALLVEYSRIQRVKVLLDRRQAERRKSVPASGQDRRRAERRRRPFGGFAVVRGEDGASRG
ncbi:MAG: hypothetical protein ACE5JD_01370 [Candidatus Methylomirabilia bacterium]